MWLQKVVQNSISDEVAVNTMLRNFINNVRSFMHGKNTLSVQLGTHEGKLRNKGWYAWKSGH